MMISALVTMISFISIISGLFSQRPNINMHDVFSETTEKICSKTQFVFNYTICFIMAICTIIGCLTDTTFVLIVLLCVLFIANYIYSFVIAVLSHKIRRGKLTNTMKYFLERNAMFPSDEELIKQFCREYRQVNIKEAKKAYNNVKKMKKSSMPCD